MRTATKMKIYDKLHHGFVWTCIGVTLFTMLNIGFKGYEYMIYVRPERKKNEAIIEQELLMEGRALANISSGSSSTTLPL